MTVKEWLSQYPALKAGMCRIVREMDRQFEDSPRLESEVEKISEELVWIEEAIDAVSDPLLREVLWVRYLHGPSGRLNPWRKVANELYGNEKPSTIKRLHQLHRKAIEVVNLPNA